MAGGPLLSIFTFAVILACFICNNSKLCAQSTTTDLYCMNGTSNLSAHKNLSCQTEETSDLNIISRRRRDVSQTNSSTATSRNVTVTHCFVFKYFLESNSTSDEHENVNTKTEEDLYSCDFHGLCENKTNDEGYQVEYEGHIGKIFCCSTNNCNVHKMLFDRDHEHTCYTSGAGINGIMPYKCVHKNSSCIKIVNKPYKDGEGQLLRVDVDYACDDSDDCVMLYNFTQGQGQIDVWDNKTDTKKEVTCCKGDNCNYDKPLTHSYSTTSKPKTGPKIQYTVVIIVGIIGALAILSASYFIVRTLSKPWKSKGKVGRYNMMSYSKVGNESQQVEVTDDTVQILSTDSVKASDKEEM